VACDGLPKAMRPTRRPNASKRRVQSKTSLSPRLSDEPRRIIEAAMIGSIGPITARELISMPPDDWGILRDRITDYASSKKTDGLVAQCMMCEGRVFIQTRVKGDKKLPYFVHYKGGDPYCPWFYGKTVPPDAARANQYQGKQTSAAHRMLCVLIDELVRLDPRYVMSTVGQYHEPSQSEHGRYPDVYVEWRGYRPYAIELQLSNTFQTEVSGRSVYYKREDVSLVWVLYGLDLNGNEVPQSFRDVIRRHRGNAFLLDSEAVAASREQGTLVLKCYLKSADESFDAPILVRLDQLTIPKSGLPYYEDRITAALKKRIDGRRAPWFKALDPLRNGWDWRMTQTEQIKAAFNDIRGYVSPLSSNHSGEDERFEMLRLIAIVFSIISAANGNERNYASRHPNIRAMLNTFLNAEAGVQLYALIIEELLRRTAVYSLLNGTVGKHVERAKKSMEGNLCLDGEAEWETVRYLAPEVFDERIRQELIYLDALPAWAISPLKETEDDV
jgi:hypothetical protein